MPVLPNAKWELFAQELAKGKTLEEAHGLAGYKANRSTAATLRQNPNISARVAELLAEREQMHSQSTAKAIERAALTKEWIIARLVENAERAMQAEPVKDDNGNVVGDYQYQGNVANRALELLGKEIGMFVERKEVGQPGDFDNLSDAEVVDKMKERAAELGIPLGRPSRTAH